MTATTTPYSDPVAKTQSRSPALRQVLAGGAAFDAAMGIFCLAAASDIAGWLSISTVAVRVTGAVFLLAAVTGVETLVLPRLSVRWIVAANIVFAAWCVVVLAADGPNALGAVLFAGGVVASAATAVLEQRLASGR